MRRRSRNARKNQKTLKHVDGDDIQVCDGTPVLPISMAGILFCTETNGLLLLCVYCACLLHYTPRCMTEKGPSCGCNLGEDLTKSTSITECAVCEEDVSVKKTRTHRVLGNEGIEEVKVCKSHYTRYANNPNYMFTLEMLKMATQEDLRVRMVNNAPFFHERRKPKQRA